MEKAETSIIVRTKNREPFLMRALKSIKDQTHHDYQVIIVNDGGDEKSIKSLISKFGAEFQKKIKIVTNKKSLGRWPAANIGIRNSKSEFIVLLDDDDTWQPDFLKKTTIALKNDPSTGAVITKSTLIYEEIAGKKIVVKSKEPYQLGDENSLIELLRSNTIHTAGFIYRRNLAEEVGFYNEELKVQGDWDFYVRFLIKNKAKVLDQRLSNAHHRLSAKGDQGNSVIAEQEVHMQHRNKILNEYLRKDIEAGRASVGQIMNQAEALRKSHDQLVSHIKNVSVQSHEEYESLKRHLDKLESILGLIIEESQRSIPSRIIKKIKKK